MNSAKIIKTYCHSCYVLGETCANCQADKTKVLEFRPLTLSQADQTFINLRDWQFKALTGFPRPSGRRANRR